MIDLHYNDATKERTKILMSPVWNKILKIWEMFFELIQDLKFSHFEDLTTVPTTVSIATEQIL